MNGMLSVKMIRDRFGRILSELDALADTCKGELAEDLEDKLAEEGIEPRRKEGKNGARWIVLDYAHVIVHIFHPEERQYYTIERLWQDGTNDERFEPRADA